MSRLISVNVGLPRDISWRGATVHTSVWKSPVPDRRVVRRLNIDGDGQGDLSGHGGEHRAVMVYQLDSYRYWQTYLASQRFHLRTIRRKFHRRGSSRTMKSASATATASAAHSLKSLSRA